MRFISIMTLVFVLSACNLIAADGHKKSTGTDVIKQSQMQIIQAVSAHIEVLDKFKTCISMAKVGLDLETCQKNKHEEIKALRNDITQNKNKYNKTSKSSASE